MSTDTAIIKTLREVYPMGISGTELANRLGITRGAIWARIDILRSAGFEIEASPHIGYRLIKSPEKLIGDDISSQLSSDCLIGRRIHVYKETTSTNEIADKLARGGAPNGTVVMAENQTSGKGRLGRSWASRDGKSLLFSIILYPDVSAEEVSKLTLLTAWSITKCLRTLTSKPFEIKWPNDIFYQGKKVAGILTELRADMDKVHYTIVGVGMNVQQTMDDFPKEIQESAASLYQVTGSNLIRSSLSANLFEYLSEALVAYKNEGFERILSDLKSFSCTLGKWIELRVGNNVYSGRAESIDSSGGLLVRTESGKLKNFNGGEVTSQINMG